MKIANLGILGIAVSLGGFLGTDSARAQNLVTNGYFTTNSLAGWSGNGAEQASAQEA